MELAQFALPKELEKHPYVQQTRCKEFSASGDLRKALMQHHTVQFLTPARCRSVILAQQCIYVNKLVCLRMAH